MSVAAGKFTRTDCCQRLSEGVSIPMPSPFGRLLSLGYYDGTTAGVTVCKRCSTEYRYELVAWDQAQEVRVFWFARTPAGTLGELTGLLSIIEAPRWPFWSPVWRFESEREREDTTSKLEALLGTAEPPSLVLAAVNLDREILASRKVDAAMQSTLPAKATIPPEGDWDFWRPYLGM